MNTFDIRLLVVLVLISLFAERDSYAGHIVQGIVSDVDGGKPLDRIEVRGMIVDSEGQLQLATPRLFDTTGLDGKFRIELPDGFKEPISIAFYDPGPRPEGLYTYWEYTALSSDSDTTINPVLYRIGRAPASLLSAAVRRLASSTVALEGDSKFSLEATLIELVARQRKDGPDRIRFGKELNEMLAYARPARRKLNIGTEREGWMINEGNLQMFRWPDTAKDRVAECSIVQNLGYSGDWLLTSRSGIAVVRDHSHPWGHDSEFFTLMGREGHRSYLDLMLSSAASSAASGHNAIGSADGEIFVIDSDDLKKIAGLELGASPITAVSLREYRRKVRVAGATIDGRMRVWEATSEDDGRLSEFKLIRDVRLSRSFPNSLALSSNLSLIFVGSGFATKDCGISVVSVSTGFEVSSATKSPVLNVADFDREDVVSIEESGTMIAWKLTSDHELRQNIVLTDLGIESAIPASARKGVFITRGDKKQPLFVPLSAVEEEQLKLDIMKFK
ncbi:MAG: hypothetical protein R3C18_27450 [Planctomycetaceae bacterium]